MTYSLTGCVRVDFTQAVAVYHLVELIASYAGSDAANFCSLFSDETFASVCFPGVVLDIPASVTDEIEGDVQKLAAYKVPGIKAHLICTRNTITTNLRINDS